MGETGGQEESSIFFSYQVISGPYVGCGARLLHWSEDGAVGYFEVRKGKETVGPIPICRPEVRFKGARGK